MKKILLLAGVASFVIASSASALEVNPYVSAKLSYDWAKNDIKWQGNDDIEKANLHKQLWGGHFAVGGKSGAVRTELEYNFSEKAKKRYSDERITLDNQSVMLNAYYDINTCTRWTPYVGAGIGVAMLKGTERSLYENEKASDRTYNFAWQLGAGVAYDLTDHVALDAGYRYIDYGTADFSSDGGAGYYEKLKADAAAHEVYAGVRYTF